VLGDFFIEEEDKLLTDIMVEEGHAVAYFGGSKEEIQIKHLANRQKLLREGVVVLEEK
jgi:endonuclease YncB( thermonuclease family)